MEFFLLFYILTAGGCVGSQDVNNRVILVGGHVLNNMRGCYNISKIIRYWDWNLGFIKLTSAIDFEKDNVFMAIVFYHLHSLLTLQIIVFCL